MKEKIYTTTPAELIAFEDDFAKFWELEARAQFRSQMLGVIRAKISQVKGEERRELEEYRDAMKDTRSSLVAEIFGLIEKLSKQGNDECEQACYEMLERANKAICLSFAPIAANHKTLSDFFEFEEKKEDLLNEWWR